MVKRYEPLEYDYGVAECDLGDDALHSDYRALAESHARLLEAQAMGVELNTPDFLEWIADRLVHVHGENPHVDYVLSLRVRAKAGRTAIAAAQPFAEK